MTRPVLKLLNIGKVCSTQYYFRRRTRIPKKWLKVSLSWLKIETYKANTKKLFPKAPIAWVTSSIPPRFQHYYFTDNAKYVWAYMESRTDPPTSHGKSTNTQKEKLRVLLWKECSWPEDQKYITTNYVKTICLILHLTNSHCFIQVSTRKEKLRKISNKITLRPTSFVIRAYRNINIILRFS
jgi:hypothetical protein